MAEKKVKTERESWKEYLEKVDTPKLQKARGIGNTVFVTLLVELVILLIVGGVVFINYCRRSFVLYENSQLSHKVDSVLEELNAADGDALAGLLSAQAPEGTQFDDPQKMMELRYDALADMDFTAREKSGYDPSKHDFVLFADGEAVGEFTIVSGNQETRLGLLTFTEWIYDGGYVNFDYERYSRTYVVPTGFKVAIDGVELGDEYIYGEDEPISGYEYVTDYADMPRMRTYVLEGLLEVPNTVIYDNLGNEVEFDRDAEVPELPDTYLSADIPEEYADMAIDMAQRWANYTLRDVTLEEIKEVLIPGSFLYVQVLDSNKDRRYIDAHDLKGYSGETVTEFIRFSDNCFSCRVSMDRTVVTKAKQNEVTDHLDNIFYFIRLDLTDDGADNPKWYIADMQSA